MNSYSEKEIVSSQPPTSNNGTAVSLTDGRGVDLLVDHSSSRRPVGGRYLIAYNVALRTPSDTAVSVELERDTTRRRETLEATFGWGDRLSVIAYCMYLGSRSNNSMYLGLFQN